MTVQVRIMSIFAALAVSLVANSTWSQEIAALEYCSRLKSSNEPMAILIAPDGRESAGPIQFGRLPVSSNASGGEDIFFPSGYRVVIAPPRVKVHNLASNGYSVRLDRLATSLCRSSTTYAVNLYMNFKPGGARPYKFSDDFPRLSTIDRSGHEVGVDEAYRFDARLFGELTEPGLGETDALKQREALRSKPTPSK